MQYLGQFGRLFLAGHQILVVQVVVDETFERYGCLHVDLSALVLLLHVPLAHQAGLLSLHSGSAVLLRATVIVGALVQPAVILCHLGNEMALSIGELLLQPMGSFRPDERAVCLLSNGKSLDGGRRIVRSVALIV